MKKKVGLIYSAVACFLIVALVGVGVVASVTTSFTITNKITYTSSDIYYKVTGSIYLLSKDEWEDFSDIGDLISNGADKKVVVDYYGDFSGDDPTKIADSEEVWDIPDDKLRFTSEKRILIYAFQFENTGKTDISITLTIPTLELADQTKITNISPVNSLSLNAKGGNVTTGTIYMVCECLNVRENFEIDNSFDINLEKVVAE